MAEPRAAPKLKATLWQLAALHAGAAAVAVPLWQVRSDLQVVLTKGWASGSALRFGLWP